MYHNFLMKHFQLKLRLSMDFQPSGDSFVSVVWGLSVVGGTGGKKMTP